MEQIQVIDFAANLNKVVADYIENLEKELNKNSIPYGDLQPFDGVHCWQIQSVAPAFRIPNKKQDPFAFKLPPFTAGMVKDVEVKDEDRTKILVRRILGYMACSRIVEKNDPKYTEAALKPLILEMLMSLEQELGFSPNTPHHGKYGTFNRPGIQDGMYFRDLEDYAGCELRLFSDTFPLVNLKAQK